MLHLMRLWPGIGWMARVIAFHGIGVRFRRVQKDTNGTIAIEVHGQSFVNVKKGEAVRRHRCGLVCLPKKTCRSCLAGHAGSIRDSCLARWADAIAATPDARCPADRAIACDSDHADGDAGDASGSRRSCQRRSARAYPGSTRTGWPVAQSR